MMNKKDALYVEQNYIKKLDDIIEYLQWLNSKGKNVYMLYNGHRLYSSDITFDGAYMEIIGLNKSETDNFKVELKSAKDDAERKAIIAKWQNTILKHKVEARAGATPTKKRFSTVEDAVEYLQDCKRDGINTYVIFNGCRLYSNDATVESAYYDLNGIPKSEYEKMVGMSKSQLTTDKQRSEIQTYIKTKRQIRRGELQKEKMLVAQQERKNTQKSNTSQDDPDEGDR